MENRESSSPKPKIIDSFWAFLIATAIAGPLALPLLWRNPRYQKSTKIWASVLVIIFTLFLIYGAGSFIDNVLSEYKQVLELQQ